FFLENSDLFGSFGFDRVNPFFSRRIGVTRDTSTGEGLQNPIIYGARLSGKLNDNLRAGFLNMQAARNLEQGLPSYNYTVATLQQKVGDRSNVGGIFVNKQNFGDFTDTTETNLNFNRVVGIDYNLATSDNKWTGKTFLHRSFSDRENGDDYTHGFFLNFRERHWDLEYFHVYTGEDYNAEVGFVPRTGIFTSSIGGRRLDYPDNPNVVQKGPGVEVQFFTNPGEGQGITVYNYDFNYNWRYANTSELTLGTGFQNIFLFEGFDPTRTDATPLPGNRDYGFWRAGFEYRSDRRKRFSARVEADAGEFFNGRSYGIGGSLVYRYQPFGAIDLRVNYQYIDLPEPYASTPIFLIGPRIDFTFSKSIFLTTFLQYNDQIDNINVNARFQWRFAPVSDFFLVYTDNYDSLDYSVKNRSLVAKVTYWLNI
ncbi:MAG: hypothetical protein AAFN92_07395, partial [Bacteroidota bacterium]